jgi:hypothetical protein
VQQNAQAQEANLRKSIFTLLAIIIVSTPLVAAPKLPRFKLADRSAVKVEALPADSDLFTRVSQQYLAFRKAERARVRATAIADIRSVRAFVIPVGGNAAGGGNTFFRSDVTVANYGNTQQQIAVAWIARGVSIQNPPTKVLTFPADTTVTFRDFVGRELEQTGIGSMFFVPIFNGQFDPLAAVDGYSRIYTNQPGSTGTVSQPFAGVDPDSFFDFSGAVSLGLRHDSAFRTNYFITNTESRALTFTIVFFGSSGLQNQRVVTVPPASLFFDSVPPNDNYGDLAILFLIDAEPASWVGGGSSTDNITADGYVSIASAVFGPDELDEIGQ